MRVCSGEGPDPVYVWSSNPILLAPHSVVDFAELDNFGQGLFQRNPLQEMSPHDLLSETKACTCI